MGLDFWRDVSVVWLSLLCFVGLLIPLVATYYAIRGMHAALGKSRSAFGAAQSYSSAVRRRTEFYSRKIAGPVVEAEREAAKAQTVIRTLADDLGR